MKNAKLIGKYDYDTYDNDILIYVEEKLYLTESGDFLLANDKRPESVFLRSDNNPALYKSSITPITLYQAKRWALDHLSCDTYDNLFGDL